MLYTHVTRLITTFCKDFCAVTSCNMSDDQSVPVWHGLSLEQHKSRHRPEEKVKNTFSSSFRISAFCHTHFPPAAMAHYSATIILSSIRELIQGKPSCASQSSRYAPALEVLSA